MNTMTIADMQLPDARKLSPEWFTEFGWVPHTDGGWQRTTPWGKAQVRQATESASWTQYVLEGGALRPPTPGTYLRRQQDLVGPFKYVRSAAGSIVCRGDVPQSVEHVDDRFHDPREISQSVWTWQWLRHVTDLLEGYADDKTSALDPLALTKWLEQHGRTATCDGGQVLVHMSLAGCFAQIRCQRVARCGILLSTDLLSLENMSPRVQRAMLRFIAEANDRLPLARFVMSDTVPSHLACEVSLGSVRIPGTWFLLALEAMEAAVTHTVRELLALRDPTLARRYLAVTTA